jgi:hypothetical protein
MHSFLGSNACAQCLDCTVQLHCAMACEHCQLHRASFSNHFCELTCIALRPKCCILSLWSMLPSTSTAAIPGKYCFVCRYLLVANETFTYAFIRQCLFVWLASAGRYREDDAVLQCRNEATASPPFVHHTTSFLCQCFFFCFNASCRLPVEALDYYYYQVTKWLTIFDQT